MHEGCSRVKARTFMRHDLPVQYEQIAPRLWWPRRTKAGGQQRRYAKYIQIIQRN